MLAICILFFWSVFAICSRFPKCLQRLFTLIATLLNLFQLSVMDGCSRKSRVSQARPVRTVFPSLVSPCFLLHHIAPFSTSPAQHGQQQLENCVRMCRKTKSRHVTCNGADFIKGGKTDRLLVTARLKATVLPKLFLSECEESEVASYLQATGKLRLWLMWRATPSAALGVCVGFLVILHGKEKTI